MTVGGLEHRIRPAGGEPDGALVLLHGRGADENDLFPLLDVLDPGRRLVGVTPRAPLTLPPGGAHWYQVWRIGFPEPATFFATYPVAAAWLDDLLDAIGVAIERTVIGGFSQGAVMSYALGLAAGRPSPAAIIGLSGFVPTIEGFELDLDRPGLPVLVAHGTQDAVIGVEWGRDARDRLGAAGLDVRYHEGPIGHSLDPGLLRALPAWVEASLGQAG